MKHTQSTTFLALLVARSKDTRINGRRRRLLALSELARRQCDDPGPVPITEWRAQCAAFGLDDNRFEAAAWALYRSSAVRLMCHDVYATGGLTYHGFQFSHAAISSY